MNAPAPLSAGSLVVRFAIIVLIVGGLAGAFGFTAGWFSPQALTPEKFIDTFEQVNGPHPGFRRNHAKGLGVSGYFTPNGNGVALSRAQVFNPKLPGVPVIGRFAIAGGNPFITDAPQLVRSMAIEFRQHDGQLWRTGMNDIPVFPVATPQAFYEQLLAGAPDPKTGKPDPANMKAFLAKYPHTAAVLPIIQHRPISSGFADSTYFGLNAFRFINADGKVTFVRWSMVPVQPFVAADPAQHPASGGDNNYLFDDLIAAIHQHPLQWRLIVTVAGPDDVTDDASIMWPADRQQVDVGTLTIDHVEAEQTSIARDTNFDPLILPDGIAGSDDPLLPARSAAYSESFTRRESETKTPSAITPPEVNTPEANTAETGQ